MYVTTDAVAVSCLPKQGLKVLLIRRASAPFERFWALPGGFVEEEEDLPQACMRELEEETGVRPAAMVQLGAFGKPGRDPRGRNVSIAYLVAVRPQMGSPRAGSDAAQVEWHLVDALPALAFDHEDIVAAGMDKLRALIVSSHLIFAIISENFRLEELRDALAAVREEPVTAQEALAFLKRARVVRQAEEASRDSYRCIAADFLVPLR